MGGGGGGAGGAASCVTVCACDPTVTVPVRGSVAVFGATVYSTLPEPVPEVLPGMPIQLTDVPAVHVQEAADAATATARAPPSAGTVRVAGSSETVQTGVGCVELRRHATATVAVTLHKVRIRMVRRRFSMAVG